MINIKTFLLVLVVFLPGGIASAQPFSTDDIYAIAKENGLRIVSESKIDITEVFSAGEFYISIKGTIKMKTRPESLVQWAYLSSFEGEDAVFFLVVRLHASGMFTPESGLPVHIRVYQYYFELDKIMPHKLIGKTVRVFFVEKVAQNTSNAE